MSLRARLGHLRPTAIRTIQLLAFLHLFTTDVLELRDCAGFSMLPTLSHQGDRVLVSPLPYWAPWPRLFSWGRETGVRRVNPGQRQGSEANEEETRGERRWNHPELSGNLRGRPKVGDVVVATSLMDPRATVCKRVVAVEGDLVEVEPRRSDPIPTDGLSEKRSIEEYEGDGTSNLASSKPSNSIGSSVKEGQGQSEGEGEASGSVEWDWRRQSKRRPGEDKFVRVPKGHVWLVGDNLSNSTDSRTYGPVPLAVIKGKVIARVYPNFKWMDNNARPVDS